jgi:7-keto-8-aminopelargonate synthetase-like enzyme
LYAICRDSFPSLHRGLWCCAAPVLVSTRIRLNDLASCLQKLANAKSRYAFLLLVDDAHATLVLGDQGRGTCDLAKHRGVVDVFCGTLSKAIGSVGGFVACTHEMKSMLVNAGRAYVYSTAIPMPSVAGALAALQVFRRCDCSVQI